MPRRSVVSAGVLLFLSYISTVCAQGIPVLWVDPLRGPICAGPLGSGPCASVAQWMKAHPGSGAPNPTPAPRKPLAPSITASSVRGAIQCAQLTGQNLQPNVDKFLTCTRGALVLDRDSPNIYVHSVKQANGNTSQLATCAGGQTIGSRLSRDQIRAINCAAQNSNDVQDFAGCMSSGIIADQLNLQQRALLECAAKNSVDSGEFAGCAGRAMFGDRVSAEARAAIDCAVENREATCKGLAAVLPINFFI